MSSSRLDCFLSSLSLPSDTLTTAGTLFVVEQVGLGIDAQFATHFLLRDFILQDERGRTGRRRVVLVTTQSSRHWSEIGTKLGWNLGEMQKNGNLLLMDLLDKEWTNFSMPSTDDGGDGVDKEKISENDLFAKISSALQSPTQENGTDLIVIEDLSALLYMAEVEDNQERELIRLLFKLKCLAKTTNASILTLVHSVASSLQDIEGARFSAIVSQSLADVSLTVSPLSTGASPQISGHLKITINDKINANKRKIQMAQYKLEDRNVRVTFI